MRKTYSGYITSLLPNQIFVFGSNPEGRHGKGVAKLALNKFGAIYGKGHGLQISDTYSSSLLSLDESKQYQPKSYALITKNLTPGYYDKISGIVYHSSGMRSVSPAQIIANIKILYSVAIKMNKYEFLIAYKADGKNLNGYSDGEMASFFDSAGPIPINIVFEDKFYELIKKING